MLHLLAVLRIPVTMKPDIEKYRKYVDHFDISEEHKIELINIIWNMMENFVDRAFGADSVQICLGENTEKNVRESMVVIDSE